MKNLLAVGLGGFVGSILRFLLSVWVGQKWGRSFPMGTLVVNIIGCFFIGFVATLFSERIMISPSLKLLLSVGFIGSFTTFSTFEYETGTLLYDGEWVLAALNVIVSLLLGFISLKIGEISARSIG